MIFDNSYQKKLERHIARYSVKRMSNAKWTKVFKKLSTDASNINKCFIKSIWDNNLREIQLPDASNYDTVFTHNGVKDVLISGPFQFKEIEQLIFPSTWSLGKETQNIQQISHIIQQVGEIEMHLDEKALIVYAYQ
jgi:hypothetical protein